MRNRTDVRAVRLAGRSYRVSPAPHRPIMKPRFPPPGFLSFRAAEESRMPEGDSAAVERIIANTINKTARGDPDALAARIVAALAEAGFRIVPAKGTEDTGL